MTPSCATISSVGDVVQQRRRSECNLLTRQSSHDERNVGSVTICDCYMLFNVIIYIHGMQSAYSPYLILHHVVNRA